MKITPLLDKVVVKEIEEKAETKSGILLSQPQEKPCKAKVLAVGQGGMVDGSEVKMLVKVGDTVLYSKFAGSDFNIDGENIVILKQADILAILED